MKKLLQIPLLKIGAHGGTRVLIELANHAAQHDFSVRLIYPKGRIFKKYDLHSSITLIETPAIGIAILDSLIFLILLPFYLRKGTLVANFFITFYPVWVASLLFNRPYIYLVQDIETWFTGFKGFFLNSLCKLTWHSKRMISSSTYIANELERRGYVLFNKISVGVAPSFFIQEKTSSTKFDLVVFPRTEIWKRTDRLLSIIKQYRQDYGNLSVLCVAQHPDLFAKFQALDCQCLQPMSEFELIDAYDSSRIVLFTSEREGLGLPPLEGMARGLPAIVYKNGGSCSYMLDGKNGFYIQSDDEAVAVASLHRLLTEENLYKEQSAIARKTAQNLSMTVAFEQLCAQLQAM